MSTPRPENHFLNSCGKTWWSFGGELARAVEPQPPFAAQAVARVVDGAVPPSTLTLSGTSLVEQS